MYLEKLKNEYKTLEDNIKKLEENDFDDDVKKELFVLREELIKLNYKIKREELFSNYRNHKPMNYHFVDYDGSEIDVMLDYGDVNYDSAYKQSRNKILEDETWDIVTYERENSAFVNPNIDTPDKEDIDLSHSTDDKEIIIPNHFDKNYKYLVFRVNDRIHIISDAPVNYLKSNVNLIKNYLGKENFKFILHDNKASSMIIDSILVKNKSDGFSLTGDVDEYESSEIVNIISKNDISSEKSDNGESVTDSDKKKIKNGDTVIYPDNDFNKKEVNACDFINLMREDKYFEILKLIGLYGISSLWNSFEDGIKSGIVSKEEFNEFVNYLRGKVLVNSSFYRKLFNDDFKRLDINDVKDEEISNKAVPPIPAKPVKRKKAKKSLIDKFKGLSRGKKIAVVAAGIIAVVGIGIFASHIIPMVMDKINTSDAASNTTFENYKVVGRVSKGVVHNFMDRTQGNFHLVKDGVSQFNTINAGDTVFSSASDSISGINGVSASGDFRDTVVAVFDNATQKVIRITPDNIDSVKGLLDDPNIPKAFGDSFTPGNVSGWKTGTGYKTIVDALNTVGGRSL